MDNIYVLDINSYSIEEIVDIFDLEAPVTRNKIEKIVNDFDNRYD